MVILNRCKIFRLSCDQFPCVPVGVHESSTLKELDLFRGYPDYEMGGESDVIGGKLDTWKKFLEYLPQTKLEALNSSCLTP